MRSITVPILAIAVLSLCATPFVHAQTSSGVEAKLKSMEDAWAKAQMNADHGAAVVEGLLAADYAGVNSKEKCRAKPEGSR